MQQGFAGIQATVAAALARQPANAEPAEKGGEAAQPPETFPEPLEPRADEFGKQLVRLAGQTGVDPVVAATRGIVLDDELANLIASKDEVAARVAAQIKKQVDDRVGSIHPLVVNKGG